MRLLVLYSEVKIWVPEPDNSELPALWWDAISDKCLLLGVFKHGNSFSTNVTCLGGEGSFILFPFMLSLFRDDSGVFGEKEKSVFVI